MIHSPFPVQTQRFHISDQSGLYDAIAGVEAVARQLEFSAQRRMQAATCVSELGTNILKYARRGVITLSVAQRGRGQWQEDGLEVVAEDRGPGIGDLIMAMRDHYSTSGTLGLGLPGVRRMSDEFKIASQPGQGTCVSLRIWREAAQSVPCPPASHVSICASPPVGRVNAAWHARPAPGEWVCGDRALFRTAGSICLMAVADGLGHGPIAAEAARIAVQTLDIQADPADDPVTMLRLVHAALHDTRGAAVGLIRVDLNVGIAVCAGVGNVQMACLRGPRSVDAHASSTDGVLGKNWRTPHTVVLTLAEGDILLVASDGLPSPTSSQDLPTRGSEAPGDIARGLVERLGKNHDDACCLIGRWML